MNVKRVANKIKRKTRAICFNMFRPNGRKIRHLRYRGAEFTVFANEDMGWRLIAEGEHERVELNVIDKIIRPEDTCVDIGANIGLYSILMGKRACNGKVFSFEPVPINRSLLMLNVALNNLQNINVIDAVVGNTEGMIDFSVSMDSAYSSIIPTNRKSEKEKIHAKVTTLDSYFYSDKEKVDFIKVDVEGAELLVLKGAERLLTDEESGPRAVLIELNAENQEAYGYTPWDIIQLMKKYDFDAYSLTFNGVEQGWPRNGAREDVLFIKESGFQHGLPF